jgi:hypothetical protein
MINHPLHFIFIHIPKNGGTSISSVLKGISGTEEHGGALRQDIDGWPQHMTSEQVARQTAGFGRYYSFAFVRNPYERMVSQYLWRCRKHGNWIEEGININRFGRRDGWNTSMVKEVSFRDFLMELYPFEEVSYNQHMRPQVDYTHSGTTQVVSFIGRVETIQQDFNQVCDRIGVPREKLPHANSTNYASLEWPEFYTTELQEIVFQKYKKDFYAFGYSYTIK